MTILDAEYLLTRTRDGEGLGDEVDEALDMAIKALKQYGALQEIRQEIESNMEWDLLMIVLMMIFMENGRK